MDCLKIWTMFCSDVERVDIDIIKNSIRYMGNLHDNKRNNITPQITVQVIDFLFLCFLLSLPFSTSSLMVGLCYRIEEQLSSLH